MRLTDAFEAAQSHEVAVKPSSEGFANGASELYFPFSLLKISLNIFKLSKTILQNFFKRLYCKLLMGKFPGIEPFNKNIPVINM